MEDDVNEPFLHYKDNEAHEDDDIEIAHNIRKGFIVKVYGIIIFQLIITSIVVFLALKINSFKLFIINHFWLNYLSLFISLACVLCPICFQGIYKKVPTNYIILFVFTLSESWVVAYQTCLYTPRSVMIALIMTIITVLTLTIYAWTTKKDFTILGGTLFVSLVLLIFISFILLLFPVRIGYLIYLVISLILFSIYLIYDTQLVIGGRRYSFSEDDYILAAMNIYLDIIILFLKILALTGKKE